MHALIVLAILHLTSGRGPKCVDVDMLANIIEFEAEQDGVDPLMVAAIISNESDFNACEVSHDHKDLGLMQLRTTGAGKGWKRQALLDPSVNVHLGVAYFALQARRCRTFVTALRAYNAGSCRAGARRPRSRPYSKHVLRRYFSLAGLASV